MVKKRFLGRRITSKCRLLVLVPLLVVLLFIKALSKLTSSAMSPYEQMQRALWLQTMSPYNDFAYFPDIVRKPITPDNKLARLIIENQYRGPFYSPYILPVELDFSHKQYFPKKQKGNVTVKFVHFWNSDDKKDNRQNSLVDFSRCEYNHCNVSASFQGADAVVFTLESLRKVSQITNVHRNPNQYWIFKSMEEPWRFDHHEPLNKTHLKEYFNWTMTYRTDSDIHTPLYKLIEKASAPVIDYDKLFALKKKTAAFFANFCQIRSGSLEYVKEMQKRIDVDIFGPCGGMQCSGTGPIPWDSKRDTSLKSAVCLPMVSRMYKFYLAFETSLCRDYITGTFFQLFNDVHAVPVVRGGSSYSNYFTSGMYVDAANFTSPQLLADFLSFVGNETKSYTRFLHAKNRYYSVVDFPPWYCKLCQKLHTETGRKTYKDVHQWWVHEACKSQ